jgi:hypothetical protein
VPNPSIARAIDVGGRRNFVIKLKFKAIIATVSGRQSARSRRNAFDRYRGVFPAWRQPPPATASQSKLLGSASFLRSLSFELQGRSLEYTKGREKHREKGIEREAQREKQREKHREL